jgi:hypothetical protein
MKRKIAVLLAMCLAMTVLLACKGGGKRSSAPPAAKPSFVEPIMGYESYRKAFNEVASELYDIQWVKDLEDKGHIDVAKGELFIPDAKLSSFNLKGGRPVAETPELMRALDIIGKRLEEKRRAAVEDALKREVEYHSTFDLAVLTKPNRDAARLLVDAAHHIENLYEMQNHPNSLIYERELIQKGDPRSMMFFKRMASPMSIKYGDPLYANAVSSFPDRMFAAAMWPHDMNGDVIAQIGQVADEKERVAFTSPFTVVKKDKGGRLMWLPYGAYPPFQGELKAISSLLMKASGIRGLSDPFARQLMLQSSAIVSGDPYPFFESDQAWVKSDGQLELVIGPYETERDPYGTKSFYEFLLAAENPKATELLSKLKTFLPEIELGISQSAPEGMYEPRKIDADPSLRVVDVIIASGMSASEDSPFMASVLPNVGPLSGDERRKMVIMANHHKAKLPILKAVANAVLTPYMADLIDADAFVSLTTLLALMQPLGPQGYTKTQDQRTVDASLGASYNTLKQVKAGVAAAWSAHLLASRGIISAEELKRFYATYLANLFRYMSLGIGSPYGAAAASEFSYLIYHGAIRETSNGLEIDFERIQQALAEFMSETVSAMTSGSNAAAEQMLVGYPLKSSDLLSKYLSRLKAANIPSDVAVCYHIEGM